MKKIAIYSGSFNPPTIAHIETMKLLSKRFYEVWVIPAVTHRQKDNLIDINHRMNMTQLAIDSIGCKNVKLSYIEIENDFKGKAFNIVEHIKSTFPKFKFYYVIGYDVVNSITSWYNYQEFVANNNFFVIPRKGVKAKPSNLELFYYGSQDVNIVVAPNIPGFSSKQARDLLSINYQKCNNGICDIENDEINNLIPTNVVSYINEKNLYKVVVEKIEKKTLLQKLFKK